MNRRAAPFAPPPIIPIWRGRPIPEIKALHDSLDRYHQYLVDRMNDLIGPNGIINTGSQGAGTPIASANSISISDFLHHVTGTQTINTINPPLGFSAPTILISQDGFSLQGGGNIQMPTPQPVQIPAGSYAQLVYHAAAGLWHVTGLGGPVFHSMTAATGNYTVLQTDYLITLDATNGNVTATLPAATGSGRELKFARIDNVLANSAGIAAGTGAINGSTGTTFLSAQWATIMVTDYAAGAWLI